MRGLAAFLVVGCLGLSGAWAQVAPPASPNSPTPAEPARPPGKAQSCDPFYPTTEARAGVDGTTTLSVRITDAGDLEDGKVVQSSGNADLDAAAITCASNYFIMPATQSGLPIDIVWTVQIHWLHQVHSYLSLEPHNSCPARRYYPPAAIRLNAQGTTLVSFQVATDGSVHDPKVAQSSGSTDLDQASIDCVSQWRYSVATRQGQPVEFEWRAKFNWRLHR